jgi:hypothetical protein
MTSTRDVRTRPRQTLTATIADLQKWLATAPPGDAFVYHAGFLCMDRVAGSRLVEHHRRELGRVADAAMRLAETGQVHLVQRRHGAGDYTYIAIVSSSPRLSSGRNQMLETAS